MTDLIEQYERDREARRLPGVVVQRPDLSTLPKNLLTLEDLAKSVPLSAERLDELSHAGYLPCWIIDDKIRLYELSAVRKYIARNLIAIQEGSQYPRVVAVQTSAAYEHENLPAELVTISKRLLTVPTDQPGVYFLILGQEVVYVGQSSNVGNRIASHRTDPQKEFDFAVFLPVPTSQLLRVEASFIKTIKPRFNRAHNNSSEVE